MQNDPNVGGGVDRDKIPAEDFAGKDRSFPIVTPGDVEDAAASIGRAGEDNYSSDKLKANIIKIAKRKGAAFVEKLPDTWKEEIERKSIEDELMGGYDQIDLSYVKSIRPDLTDDGLLNIVAAKNVGPDKIFHYPFLWGNDKVTDLTKEFFTKGTDLWDSVLQHSPRPLTWDHATDNSMKSNPIVGKTVEWGDDEIGRWAVSQLDRSHKYYRAIRQLIERGVIGTSSDSAPQYVLREDVGKSAWLKRWPWFASALTVTPCEPRMIGTTEFFKSIGIDLPSPEVPDEQVRIAMQKAAAVFNSIIFYGD